MPVSSYNSLILIDKTSTINLNLYDIGLNIYKFFGFSSFTVGLNANEVNLGLDVRDIYNLILTTSNSLTNVQVSGDFFTKSIDITCISTLI